MKTKKLPVKKKNNMENLKVKKEPTKIYISDLENFENIKKKLVFNKRDFRMVTSGSITSIHYMGKEFVKVNVDDFKGKGFHISTMFRNEIDKWLKVNSGKLTPHPKDYKEQMFCLGHIEQYMKKPMVMIDISGCYWQTAYKLGYIGRDLFIAGRRKDGWKTGRNAAIGGLCKREYDTPYMEGKMVNELRSIREPKREYQWVRNHIIGHVYKMFDHLYNGVLGRKFCMFLTDSVVTTPDMANEVKKYFMGEGYKCTQKAVEFTKLNRKDKTVFWFDFTAEIKDKEGKVVGNGVEKYYQYSYNQVLPDFIQETFLELTTQMFNNDSESDSGSFCSPECSLHYFQTGEINPCCEVTVAVDAKTGKKVYLPDEVIEMFDQYLWQVARKSLKPITKAELKAEILKWRPELGSVDMREPYSARELKTINRLWDEINGI